MARIIVDQDRCTECGICVEVCPLRFTFDADESRLPRALEKVATFCVGCGHCEISCPSGALALEYPHDERKEKESAIEPCSVSQSLLGSYIKSRRSVRSFTSRKVDRELILQILDIARYAASGCNAQPVAWTVVYEKQEVNRLAGLTIDWMRQLYDSKDPMGVALRPLVAAWDRGFDAICWNAPHLLVAHIPESNASAPAAPTDGIIAMTHFDIAAPAFGVGTCWAGFLTVAARSWKPLQEALALPQGRTISYAMMFGYPKFRAYRLPQRSPLQVTWL